MITYFFSAPVKILVFLLFIILNIRCANKLPPVHLYLRPTTHQEDSLNSVFKNVLCNKNWAVSSIKVMPSINGVDTVPVDTCNKRILFNFQNNSNYTYGNGGLGVVAGGNLLLKYPNGLCKSSRLPAGTLDTSVFLIQVDSLTIKFPDNGINTNPIPYNIKHLTSDSLVLTYKRGIYTYLKVYLNVN